jgi:hypothetical protein
MLFRGRARVCNHGFDLAAKTFFVKLERLLAIAMKQ